jgi:hypothetical protein
MQRSLGTGWFDDQSNPLVLINIRKRRDWGTNGGRAVSARFSIIDFKKCAPRGVSARIFGGLLRCAKSTQPGTDIRSLRPTRSNSGSRIVHRAVNASMALQSDLEPRFAKVISVARSQAENNHNVPYPLPQRFDDLRHAALRSGICRGMHFDGRNMQDSVSECILASALSFNFLGLPILVLAKTGLSPG